MHNLTIVSDIHIGAPHNEGLNEESLFLLKKKESEVVLSGDIFDMTNCKKSMAPYYCAMKHKTLDLYGRDYILGNHEAVSMLTRGQNYSFQIKEINNKRVVIFHGPGIYVDEDTYYPVYYSQAKTERWASKSWGRGRFSYWKYKMFRKLKKHKGGYKKPSKEIIKRIDKIMDAFWCDVAIWGHTHRYCDITIGNRRYINVNKGITRLKI